MAKQRIVNTKFWDDSYIARLTPTEKLLFLYLITNPLTNISGVYELPLKRVAFDTGIAEAKAEGIFKKLESDGKLVLFEGWVGVVNFIRHQSLNPKIKQGILSELKRAPKGVTERLSIDYQALCVASYSLSDSNSNPNSNPNLNLNSNRLPLGQMSPEKAEEIQKRTRELVNKWRM